MSRDQEGPLAPPLVGPPVIGVGPEVIIAGIAPTGASVVDATLEQRRRHDLLNRDGDGGDLLVSAFHGRRFHHLITTCALAYVASTASSVLASCRVFWPVIG